MPNTPQHPTAPKALLTSKAPAPIGPYSQAVAAGGFLFCSGQIPLHPETGALVTGDIEQQTRQVMENIQAVLEEAKLNWSAVVKTTIYLKSMNDFPRVNAIYGSYFPSNHFPARSTVEVARLPKDVGVEIEVTASCEGT
jgi:2-iminobutanoate/2-iminopropanoate deaminase